MDNKRLKAKVKTAKGRKISSTNWLKRQLNDEYVKLAKEQGYRSRAAFKLLEIDQKFKILKNNSIVVDLGSTPGGWSQVVAAKLKDKSGRLLAVDLNPMDAIDNCEFLLGDFTDQAIIDELLTKLNCKVDIVLSDMAPKSSGHQQTDHLRIIALCEEAFYFAENVLREGGSFVAKILQGGATGDFLEELKSNFEVVRHFKPPASRKDSNEIYVVALNFKGKVNVSR